MNSEAQVVYRKGFTFQMAKITIFWHFVHDSNFYSFFFGREKMLNQGWDFFWRSSMTPTNAFWSWLNPSLHNLALSPHGSWFFKNSISRFSTFKSILGILTLSECHEIFIGDRTWCKEATVQISSKSDKVKGGKRLSHCMK